jgi:hypothetical protein
MAQEHESQRTPEQRIRHVNDLLVEVQRECRTESAQVSDPEARALLAMLTEIVGGAMKALQEYQSKEHGRQKVIKERERQFAIDIDQIEPSSKASVAIPYD